MDDPESRPEPLSDPQPHDPKMEAVPGSRDDAGAVLPGADEMAPPGDENTFEGDSEDLRESQQEAIRRVWSNFEKQSRFELLRELGAGGMGVVFEAFDHEEGIRLALKTIIRLKPLNVQRFKQEFRSLGEIVHPNLIRFFRSYNEVDEWFYTMELVDGVDFLSWVRPPPDPESFTGDIGTALGSCDLNRLREALPQLMEGVRALHREGKLHRDIKPPNILVRKDGSLVLLDFGLIKDVTSASGAPPSDSSAALSAPRQHLGQTVATMGGFCGSIGYMSPEQARMSDLSEACDWYAVGVVLFEALTGRRPFLGKGWNVLEKKQRFDAPSPAKFARGLPDDLVDLCRALLDRDPERRLEAARQYEEALLEDGAEDALALNFEEAGTPFFGRREHLETLREGFDRLASGQTGMIHLRGRSGAGKSALANRFLEQISAEDDLVVLSGRCYEQESMPFKALDSVVDSLTRYLISLPEEEVIALLPDRIATLGRIFPILTSVKAVKDESRAEDIPADPFELRRLGFRVLARLLRKLGEDRRLVLYIDDLQWGDEDSAVFLRDLIQSRRPPRMLFLAGYRSEHRDKSPCLRALPKQETTESETVFIRDLDVGPLSLEEASALAAALLDDDGPEADWIAKESRGNPYFVYELTSLVKHRGDDGGGEERFSELDLDEAIWARVQRLEPAARSLLESIAVAGRPTPLRYLYKAADANPSGQPGIAALRAGHLIRSDGPGLKDEVESFHDRIRETIVSRLDRSRAGRYHLGLARALSDSPTRDPEAIAGHYFGAGEYETAAHHFLEAAEKASRALAFERAARLYRQTLRLRHLPDEQARHLRVNLADSLGNAGRGAESALAYLTAARYFSGDQSHRLHERAGYQYCVAGHIDEGRECFRGVLRHLGLRLARTRRSALISLFQRRLHLLVRGTDFERRAEHEISRQELDRIDLSWAVAGGITVIDPIPAAEFQTHNLLLALRAGEPFRISRALAWEGSHLAMVGRKFSPRVASMLDGAEKLARDLDRPLATGTVDLARCVAAFFLGDFENCRAFGDRAAQVFRNQCRGAAWELEQSQTFAYWACYWLGDMKELSRRHEILLAAATKRGARLAESQLTTFGGPFVWLARDEPEAASKALEKATAHWQDVEYQVYHYTALTAKTQIALYEGRANEALAMVEEEWPLVAGALLLHVELVRVYMWFLRSRCALAVAETTDQADPSRSLRVARRDARALRRMRPTWAKAAAAQTTAALALREGDRSTALDELERAIAWFDEEEFALLAWCARYRRDQIREGTPSAETREWFSLQEIRSPERMVRVKAPGFGFD